LSFVFEVTATHVLISLG